MAAPGRAEFSAAAVAAARERGASLALPDGELAVMVRTYRMRIRADCLESAGELPSLLETAGFAVEEQAILTQRRRIANGAETADAIAVVARRL